MPLLIGPPPETSKDEGEGSPSTTEVPSAKPATAKIDPALERQRELEEKYVTAMKPVEAKVAEWDFAGAAELAEGIRFEEEDLTRRLAVRKDEVARLAAMKKKIIDRINSAEPPLAKADLMIGGVGGDVTGADESAVTATSRSGKEESHPWADLGEKATAKLLQLAIDSDSPDDWLAGGLLAFATGDTSLAERLFDQAAAKGTDISPYLVNLATASFSRAVGLLEQEKFNEAVDALEHIREKYGTTSWFESNKPGFDAALAEAKDGVFQGEAESLYQQAVALLEQKELFGLRDVVEQLKEEYAGSLAVTDENREPPFAEMAEAVADLGAKIIVRLDGKGDFTSIQAAIDAAQPNSLIEIEDNGPYNENIEIPEVKSGLTIRGKKGVWPIIMSLGPRGPVEVLVTVSAPTTTIERLVLIHGAVRGATPTCISVRENSFRLNLAILYTALDRYALGISESSTWRLENSLVFSQLSDRGRGQIANCILQKELYFPYTCRLQSCTATGVRMGNPTVCIDCVLGKVDCRGTGNRLEHCATYGTVHPLVERGEGCFTANPQFLDPKNLDYRLAPTSPCKGKASDGGDLGCRYTPEMIEMCQIALKLRAQGVIDF